MSIGRTSVLSVTNEAFEISIVWGLWEKFSTLTSKGTTLNQLETDDRILFQKNNKIETIGTIKERGYGYAGFDERIKEDNDELYFKADCGMIYPTLSGIGRREDSTSGVFSKKFSIVKISSLSNIKSLSWCSFSSTDFSFS